jgi:protein TonB
MRLLFLSLFLLSTTVLFAQSKGVPDVPVEDTSASRLFEKVEVEASVDANLWREHLTKSLMPVIEKAASRGMKPGTYVVQVKFLIEKDGSISDVRALNEPGFGLGKAAAKVVQTGPKWIAGEQNGRKVRSYHTQPITFVINVG